MGTSKSGAGQNSSLRVQDMEDLYNFIQVKISFLLKVLAKISKPPLGTITNHSPCHQGTRFLACILGTKAGNMMIANAQVLKHLRFLEKALLSWLGGIPALFCVCGYVHEPMVSIFTALLLTHCGLANGSQDSQEKHLGDPVLMFRIQFVDPCSHCGTWQDSSRNLEATSWSLSQVNQDSGPKA